nr:MAG: RNA-dependent RNA polymerase [Wenzhou bat tapwovirus 1]
MLDLFADEIYTRAQPEGEEENRWIRVYRSDRNLSSALSESFQEFLLRNSHTNQVRRMYGDLLDEYGGAKMLQAQVRNPRTQVWRCLQQAILNHAPILSREDTRLWTRSLTIANKITQIQAERYGGCPQVDIDTLIHKSQCHQYLRSRFTYDRIIQRLSRSVNRDDMVKVGAWVLKVREETIWFSCPQCQSGHCGNYTDLLCASDVNLGRIDVLLYVAYRDLMENTEGVQVVLETFRCMDVLFDLIGRGAYDVYKAMPSLATGAVLAFHDPVDRGDFLASLLCELQVKYPCLMLSTEFAYLHRTTRSSQDVMLLLEASGLWKMGGHPTVDIQAGIDKVIETGYPHKHSLSHCAEQISWCVRYLYCYHYFQKKGRWPDADVSEADPVIKSAYHGNYWPETYGTFERLHLSSFQHVILRKSMEFDMHPDLSELISDTSIHPGYSHWHYESTPAWMHIAEYGYPPRHRIPRMRKNRPILVYMEEPGITLKTVIDRIEEGEVPEEWKAITLVAKERELKTAARFFAKNTYEVRLWQVATEKAIADLLELLPYQSMTMSNDRLQHRLINMSRGLNPRDAITQAVLILDFSSWNLQFRHNTIGPVLRDLDRIFGFKKVFSYSHLHPVRSTIFIKDPGGPIREDPVTGHPCLGPRCYRGQESYFEGLRQKGWTLYTIALIQTVAMTHQYRVELLGQGDNQAVILHIPEDYQEPDRAVRYIQEFRRHLSEFSLEAQVPMKPEETWISSILFEYGRVSFYRGAQVPAAMKKASRIGTEPNNPLTSLLNILNNCYSGGVSVSGLDRHPAPAYFLSTYECLQNMRRYISSWYMEDDPLVLIGRMIVPAEVGGIIATGYDSFCMRGCADPLTRAISVTRYIWETHPELHAYMAPYIRVRSGYKPDPLLLLQDPTCLPLDRPETSENKIRNMLYPVIRDGTSNPALRVLFSSQSEEESAALVGDLMSLRPRNARLMSTLFSMSNAALAARFIGRFTSPMSVVQAASKQITNLPELWDNIERHNQMFIRFYTRKPDAKGEIMELLGYNRSCSCTIADDLRTQYWGPLTGVTMPYPFEQVELVPWDVAVCRGLIPIMSVSLYQGSDHDPLLQVGPYEPFIGHDTEEKISRNPLDMGKATALTRSAIRLTSLIPWVCSDGDINLKSLFNVLLSEKGVRMPEALEQIQPLYIRGSLYHRLADPYSSHGCRVNSTPVLASNVLMVTDRFSKLISGGNDQTFFFQEVKAWILSMMRHMIYQDKLPGRDLALVIRCNECTRLIQEDPVKLERSPSYRGMYLPVDRGIIEPVVRDIVPFDVQPSKYLLVYSWAMGSLAASLFTAANLAERGGSRIVTQATHISSLRNVDPAYYLDALVARLQRLKGSFSTLSKAMIPNIGLDCEVGQGRVPLLVANLDAAGMLPHLFRTACYRPTSSTWTKTTKGLTSAFIGMLGHILSCQTPSLASMEGYVFSGEPSHVRQLLESTLPIPIKQCPYAENVITAVRQSLSPYTIQLTPSHVPDWCPDPDWSIPAGAIPPTPTWTSYHYLSRSLGGESTSMTKVFEVIKRSELTYDPEVIVSVAEGDGGILCFLGHLFPKVPLIYNSLQSGPRPSHSGERLVSTLYADPCNIQERLCGFDELFYGESDLTQPLTYQKLDAVIGPRTRILITCDANHSEGYDLLHQNLQRWIMSKPQSAFIIKHICFYGDYPARDVPCHKIKAVFPLSSNPITGECYLVGSPGTGPFPDLLRMHATVLKSRASNIDDLDRRVLDLGVSLYAVGVPSCFNWPEAFINTLGGSVHLVKVDKSMVPFLQERCKEHKRWLVSGKLMHLRRLTGQLVPSGCKSVSRMKRHLLAGLEVMVLLDMFRRLITRVPASPREIIPVLERDKSARVLCVLVREKSRVLAHRHLFPGPREFSVSYYYTYSDLIERNMNKILRLITYEHFLRGIPLARFTVSASHWAPPGGPPTQIHRSYVSDEDEYSDFSVISDTP